MRPDRGFDHAYVRCPYIEQRQFVSGPISLHKSPNLLRFGLGDQVKRLKELEAENARLRRAVSDLTLDKQILREAAKGNF